MTTLLRVGIAALLLALLLPAPEAHAVIPSAFGPIQALIVILPQLMLALAAGMLAIFKPRTYRLLFAYLWSHKVFSAVLLGGIGFLIFGPSWGGGVAAEEQKGVSWPAFRGGPRRTGAVEGAKGPQSAPRALWKLAGDQLGPTSAVDSSPAVVGNRIYFGLSNQSAFASSGGIYAVDADSGALAWKWTGKGELDPPLRPVFASPAVWVEAPEKGAPPAARYVVSGEGYHEDKNCRILCLDLDPVRKSKGRDAPKLAWSVQTTSHVESAPCIYEGRVYIGCGDDGVWCIELTTGRVLWRIEGCAFYEIADGPQANALAALAGKTAVVSGVVTREGLGAKGKDDAGVLVLEAKSFREHAGPPVTAMDSGATYERTVTGKVVKPAQGRLRLEMARHNPDSESPPIAVTLGAERRLLFGSGLGGMRVNCVNADTGAEIWQSPTPFPAFGAPTIDGDRVIIGVGNGNFLASDPKPAGAVLCFSLKDGTPLWTVKTGDNVIGAVAVSGGRGYACSRDGHVYVIDLEKGVVAAKWPTGSPMVSSPAVTADAVYVSTDSGKAFAFDRIKGDLKWTYALTPGSPIFCSPGVAAGKLFIGTRSKGVFALADRPAEEEARVVARPWEGPGGDAARSGTADDRGLPNVGADESTLKWPQPEALKRPVTAPPAACGRFVYAPFEKSLAQIDGATGQVVWEAPFAVREIVARPDRVLVRDTRGEWESLDPATGKRMAPAAAPDGALRLHDLVLSASASGLVCRSGWKDRILWTAELGSPALTPPTIAGDRVYVACAGTGKAKGFLHCRRLVDGGAFWKQELDEAPVSHVVASADWVSVPTADDKVAVFKAADGKARDPLLVGGRPVSPALVQDTLVIAGETRIAAHDLSGTEWLWNYKDQDHIGKVAGQPVICLETIWVGTEKRGLLAIGIPPGQAKK